MLVIPVCMCIKIRGNSSISRVDCLAKGGSVGFKVAILGAAGGIGQPLAMLMKINPLVSVLHLYDVVNTPGVTSDISHMDTGAVVRGFLGQQQLEDAVTGMYLVIIPAAVPRKSGMTRDDLFNSNVERLLSAEQKATDYRTPDDISYFDDGTSLIWISSSGERRLNLASVSRIIAGQRTYACLDAFLCYEMGSILKAPG